LFTFALFFYFATLALAGAVTAVFSRNLIYAAMALLVTLIHVAGIYILLGAEFVAAVQVIVYAGAILVLYLFVVMLFNVHGEERYLHRHYLIGVFLGIVILGEMLLALFGSSLGGGGASAPVSLPGADGNTQAIGRLLYTRYLFPFEVASVILLVAMVGAIVLGKRLRKGNEAPMRAGESVP
jgi:NADH-quinone oxidoreductase subunit J